MKSDTTFGVRRSAFGVALAGALLATILPTPLSGVELSDQAVLQILTNEQPRDRAGVRFQ